MGIPIIKVAELGGDVLTIDKWYESKRFYATLFSVIASLAAGYGIVVSGTDQATLVNYVVQGATVIAPIIAAIYAQWSKHSSNQKIADIHAAVVHVDSASLQQIPQSDVEKEIGELKKKAL